MRGRDTPFAWGPLPMAMSRNVLVTASSFPSFGSAVFKAPFVFELSRFMAAEDNDHVAISTPHVTGAAHKERREGLSIHRFRYGFSALCDTPFLPNLKRRPWIVFQIPFLVLASFLHLIQMVRHYRVGVIHAHWLLPQGALAILFRKLFRRHDVRVLVTCHGADVFGLRCLDFLKAWVLRNADAVTVVNEVMLPALDRMVPGVTRKVRVLPMGVDTDAFSPDRADPDLRRRHGIDGPLILFVGRLAEKKGIVHLIDAVPRILAAQPSARVMIVGGGPLEAELKDRVRRLGVEQAVIFTGAVDHEDLPVYYATADVFVGPSVIAQDGDREGMPVCFMEAMAAGCVAVVTDLDGIEALVMDGYNGFLVRQGDAEDIAAKITAALDLPRSLADMRRRAREHVQAEFDWRVIARQYRDLLHQDPAQPPLPATDSIVLGRPAPIV